MASTQVHVTILRSKPGFIKKRQERSKRQGLKSISTSTHTIQYVQGGRKEESDKEMKSKQREKREENPFQYQARPVQDQPPMLDRRNFMKTVTLMECSMRSICLAYYIEEQARTLADSSSSD
jgi:hypothetical protein